MRENMRIRIVPRVPKVCLTTRSRSNKRMEGGKGGSPPLSWRKVATTKLPRLPHLFPRFIPFSLFPRNITQSKREKRGRGGRALKKFLCTDSDDTRASSGLVSFNFGSCHRHSKLFSSSSGKGGEACLLVWLGEEAPVLHDRDRPQK